MGIKSTSDPDPSFVLTTDNVKKILAIYMRFRFVSEDAYGNKSRLYMSVAGITCKTNTQSDS